MKGIYGNNFLISIAFSATSPSQAAKQAQLAGYSREQVRDTRNAAVLKRDKGLDEFSKFYAPYELVDITILPCKTMVVKLFFDRTYEQRPLNTAEFNQVAKLITDLLDGFSIKATIEPHSSFPFVRSSLEIIP